MNFRIAAPLAAAALAAGMQAAAAQVPTGMSGFVIDGVTGAPIQGAEVFVTRHENEPRRSKELTTDRHGFFSDISLTPGPYLVTTSVRGQLITCIVDNVQDGVVRTMRIVVGKPGTTPQCLGALVRLGTVDPDQTASLYRI